MSRASHCLTLALFLVFLAACSGSSSSSSTFIDDSRQVAVVLEDGWRVVSQFDSRQGQSDTASHPLDRSTNLVVVGRVERDDALLVIARGPVPRFLASLASREGPARASAELASLSREFPPPPDVARVGQPCVETRAGVTWSVETLRSDGLTRAMATTVRSNAVWQLAMASVAFDPAAVLREVLDGVTFDPSDAVAANAAGPDAPGFFTALYHGFFVAPRYLWSLVFTCDVYADENSGKGYTIGFAIGALFFAYCFLQRR